MNEPLISWISKKLKDGYNPSSLEEFLEENGYNKAHVSKLIKEVIDTEGLNHIPDTGHGEFVKEVIAKKILKISMPEGPALKKWVMYATILFVIALILSLKGASKTAAGIVSMIALVFAVAFGCKYARVSKDRFFEIAIVVSLSTFITLLIIPHLVVVLIGFAVLLAIVYKEFKTDVLGSLKTCAVPAGVGLLVFYGIIFGLGMITGVVRALI